MEDRPIEEATHTGAHLGRHHRRHVYVQFMSAGNAIGARYTRSVVHTTNNENETIKSHI